MRRWLTLALGLLLAACAAVPAPRDGDILVLGDSVMAWNGQAAIPQVIAAALDRDVVSRAVPGARFDNPSGLIGGLGFDIQRQYPGGNWNWVVLNGGANDLGFGDCGCGACGPAVDRLIGADAVSGLIPAFIDRVRRESGAQVLWMGYYAGNGKGSFEGCRDDLVTLEARIARFAEGREGVHFVDSETVIDPRNPDHFASDNTHPSAEGSRLIGTALARAISARSQNRP